MERKSSIIIRYLNRLKSRYLVEVMPKLRKVSSERIVFEEYISFLVDAIFGECETNEEVIALADKLQLAIHNGKKNIFKNIVPDYVIDGLYKEPLLKIGSDGVETSDKKICRKACELICTQIMRYVHPYFSGVVRRKSLLCNLFNIHE